MKYIAWFILAVLLTSALVPSVWLGLTSLKTRRDILADRPRLAFSPTLDNYREVFYSRQAVSTLINSIVIVSGSTLLAMFLGVPAAYYLSRCGVKRRRTLMLSVLSTRMAPPVAIGLPLFLMMRYTGLLDTRTAVVIVHAAINLSLVIWLMVGYFDEVPRVTEEAAMLDGDTSVGVLRRVVIPLVLPGIGVSSLFAAVGSWNEFFFAMLLTSFDARPLTVSLPALVTPQGTHWGQIAALGCLSIAPIIIAAAIARRYLVRVLTYGILK